MPTRVLSPLTQLHITIEVVQPMKNIQVFAKQYFLVKNFVTIVSEEFFGSSPRSQRCLSEKYCNSSNKLFIPQLLHDGAGVILAIARTPDYN